MRRIDCDCDFCEQSRRLDRLLAIKDGAEYYNAGKDNGTVYCGKCGFGKLCTCAPKPAPTVTDGFMGMGRRLESEMPEPAMVSGARIDLQGNIFPPAPDPIAERLATIEALLREVLEVLKPELIPYTGGYPREADNGET